LTESLHNDLKQKTDSENWAKGKRVRVAISTTAKGLIQCDCTVELLNSDRVITIKNPNDVADVEDHSVAEALFAQLDAIQEQATKRKIKTVWEE
jgi:hypothetical protein